MAGERSGYPPSVVAPEISRFADQAYRRRALAVLVGLLGFLLVYLGLLVGSLAGLSLLVLAALGQPLWWIAVALTAPIIAVLVVFLIKGLLHRPAATETTIPVDAAAQPRLFEFLARLAADAGAPMPARVELSPGVNASMIRGRSPLSFLFGGRRRLVIGVGLASVLDLRELKAVLAHEFGHFAQSSTRLGQWTHRATKIMAEVVHGRDRVDDLLARSRGSRSVIVRGWAAVATREVTGLRRLLARMLERLSRLSLALAREMEFNADQHAVHLCGSDALVAALWRAQRGAMAMDRSVAMLRELGKHQLFSADLFHHQRRRLAELDEQLATVEDPMLVALREPYVPGPELHFPPGQAPAELSWYSHPSCHEREVRAKQPYVAGDGGRWANAAESLFEDREALGARLSATVYAALGYDPDPEQLRPAEEVEAALADELAERGQDPRYHGYYDNRIVDLGELDALIDELEGETDRELDGEALELWRGERLARFMADWDRVEERITVLTALVDGRVELPGEAEEFELHGERLSLLAAPRLLREAEADRRGQIEHAREGDRALFRWHWRHADAEQRRELVERHRFLAFVQAQIVALNAHRHRVMGLLAATAAQEYELHGRVPAELSEALGELHRDLSQLLRAAEDLAMPAMQNLEAGAALRSFLLPDELAEALEFDAGPLERRSLDAWLARFMPQAAAIHDRLRTVHYKNLGALLELQAAIEDAAEPDEGGQARSGPGG